MTFNRVAPLKALRQDLYFGKQEGSEDTLSVGFVPEAGGPVQYIMVNRQGASGVFKRIEHNPSFVPDPAAWAGYTGTYAQEPLDTYTIRIQDGKLIISSKIDDAEVTCIPLDNRRFACPWGVFEFQVGQDGRATAVKQADTWTFNRVD